MLVIDASMALAWAFERQQPEDGQRASRLLSDCGSASSWVPAVWHLEVANALLVAERRGLIASNASDLFRARLQALPIETDATPCRRRSRKSWQSPGRRVCPATTRPIWNSLSGLAPAWPVSTGGSTRRHNGWTWLWRLEPRRASSWLT